MKLLSLFAQASDYYDSSYDSTIYESTNQAQNYGNYGDPAAVAGITAFFVVLMIITCALAYVISALLLGRIFKKAGIEQWKAWVPFYNSWVMLEMGGQKGFWAVLLLVPVVNIAAAIFVIIAQYNIGLRFGKESWFVLLAIFVPVVWMAWLALDKSTWHKSESTDSPAPKSTSDTTSSTTA